ncbi:hypothetical protein ACL6C3_27200 [Capilliphycus salinus ALCB114379]|uniref:hypothetical protein n=1 Tax=Capilliphycus salinus TaxID=2768948 RepID=UPI0039A54A0A
MPPGKSIFCSTLYQVAKVRATSNILLVKHYDKLTQLLNNAPKISFVVNVMIRLAF